MQTKNVFSFVVGLSVLYSVMFLAATREIERLDRRTEFLCLEYAQEIEDWAKANNRSYEDTCP